MVPSPDTRRASQPYRTRKKRNTISRALFCAKAARMRRLSSTKSPPDASRERRRSCQSGQRLACKGTRSRCNGGVHKGTANFPENLAALSNLAWLLATSADPSLRNGSEAVRLAERADSASSRSDKHPTVLRILAAAYAEAGQFAEAKETAQHALEAANIQGNTTLADALQDELALYDLGLPYHK